MRLVQSCSFAAAFTLASAVDLFVTYQAAAGGSVSTMSLTSVKGAFQFTEKYNNTGCGLSPTWMTYDHVTDVLYCLDENNAGGPGGLASFTVSDDAKLELVHNATTGKGPVSSTLLDTYGLTNGTRGIVIAEYGKGGFSTFAFDPSLPGQFASTNLASSANVTFPALAAPGPNAKRQDKSYAHQALVDPTGQYLLIVDLGADKVWTYAVDQSKNTLELKSSTGLELPKGTGPRHAVFVTQDDKQASAVRRRHDVGTGGHPPAKTNMYIVSELSAKVFSYEVKYTESSTNSTTRRKRNNGGLTFNILGELGATGDKNITGNAPGEITISPDNKFLYTTNRLTSDFSIPNPDPKNTTFVPSDSISTFSISADGTLKFVGTFASGGISPRHMSLSKDGEYIAVAHYGSGDVSVIKRDIKTGLADLNWGTGQASAGNGTGIVARYVWPGTSVTSVIWDEC